MAVAAQSIIRRVAETLLDNGAVRWTTPELVRYLNDGQREVAIYRPDATVTNATVTLVAGSRQALPANGTKLFEVIRNNSAGSKRAVRITNREILDAQSPNWHGLTGVSEIQHFLYDSRDPKVFYVYPPASTNAALDIVYSALPTDVAEPADGTTYTAVTGNLSLSESYGNPIQDYILYRAYTKDSENPGNAARAAAHYGQFTGALGIELNGTAKFQPNPVGNPSRGTAVAS